MLLTKYHSGNQMEDEKGGECGMYGGGIYTGYWWGNTKEREQLQDPVTDGRIVIKLTLKIQNGCGLVQAQDKEKWWAVVNVVMNMQVP